MKTIDNTFPTISLEKFAEQYDLTLEINERRPSDWCVSGPFQRFYAYFRYVEEKDGPFIISVSGNGNTAEEAIADYAKKISLKRIVIDAMGSNRREIDVPHLTVE